MNAPLRVKLAVISSLAIFASATRSEDGAGSDDGMTAAGAKTNAPPAEACTNTPPAKALNPGPKLDDPVPVKAPKPADDSSAPEKDAPPIPSDLEPVLDRPADTLREWEISAAYEMILGPDAFWDAARGYSAEAAYWPWNHWGVVAQVFVTDWDAVGGEVDLPFALHHQMIADGSARTYMIGVAGGYRRPLGEGFHLLARAGLAYLTTDSSIRLSTAYRDHYGNDVAYSLFTSNVSRWAGRAGVALRYEYDSGRTGVFAQAGVDVQRALDGDDFGWLRESMGANFDAAVLRFGLGAGF